MELTQLIPAAVVRQDLLALVGGGGDLPRYLGEIPDLSVFSLLGCDGRVVEDCYTSRKTPDREHVRIVQCRTGVQWIVGDAEAGEVRGCGR